MIASDAAIVLAHGGGGQLTDELIAEQILPRLGNGVLNNLFDSALLPGTQGDHLATTIDSYVVQPWQFPGGNIGRLAVCGTVNDLAVCGAQPLGIALSLILSEGFARTDLDTVLDAVQAAANEADVRVITGDTKVVGASSGDGVFITTAGVGRVPCGRDLRPSNVKPGDVLLINGAIAEHGLTVMLAREMPEMHSGLTTDAAPLNALVAHLLDVVPGVKFMRDPTRSGLSGVATDLAKACNCNIVLDESSIPISAQARHAADMLGLDPLEVANEGKIVVVTTAADAESARQAMQEHPLGRDAAVIGRVEESPDGICELHTVIGGRRIVQKPYGEQLPRIC